MTQQLQTKRKHIYYHHQVFAPVCSAAVSTRFFHQVTLDLSIIQKISRNWVFQMTLTHNYEQSAMSCLPDGWLLSLEKPCITRWKQIHDSLVVISARQTKWTCKFWRILKTEGIAFWHRLHSLVTTSYSHNVFQSLLACIIHSQLSNANKYR